MSGEIWNSSLRRYKGLPRSNLSPKTNPTDKGEAAADNWPVKVRKRINRVSKTNSKPWENEEFKRQYMEENPECEFMKYFPRRGQRHCVIPTGIHGKLSNSVMIRQPSRDPHHCLWGLARRWDIRACLVAAGDFGHTFCHQYPDEGRILSLWVKRQKGELDWAALDQIYRGESYRDYISTKPPRFDWMVDMWRTLIDTHNERGCT